MIELDGQFGLGIVYSNFFPLFYRFCNKIDVIELGGSDELCGKGYELSLFLFSDVLEISKKKSSASKGLGLKSPSTMSLRNVGIGPHGAAGMMNETLSSKDAPGVGGGGGGPKSLKHVNLMNLTAIKRVVDVTDVDMIGANVFALVTRTNQVSCMFLGHFYIFRCMFALYPAPLLIHIYELLCCKYPIIMYKPTGVEGEDVRISNSQ